MPRSGRPAWIAGAALIAAAVVSLLPWAARLAPRATGSRASAALEERLTTLRQALDLYRDDHGWYPGDPDKDYNSDGRTDLLVRQLTWFTRDDGKPCEYRDADYCFGPYLRDFPIDPVSGSRALVLDQDRARALSRLRSDVAAGDGHGGWYYEARTGNVVANYGRGPQTRLAQF